MLLPTLSNPPTLSLQSNYEGYRMGCDNEWNRILCCGWMVLPRRDSNSRPLTSQTLTLTTQPRWGCGMTFHLWLISRHYIAQQWLMYIAALLRHNVPQERHKHEAPYRDSRKVGLGPLQVLILTFSMLLIYWCFTFLNNIFTNLNVLEYYKRF